MGGLCGSGLARAAFFARFWQQASACEMGIFPAPTACLPSVAVGGSSRWAPCSRSLGRFFGHDAVVIDDRHRSHGLDADTRAVCWRGCGRGSSLLGIQSDPSLDGTACADPCRALAETTARAGLGRGVKHPESRAIVGMRPLDGVQGTIR